MFYAIHFFVIFTDDDDDDDDVAENEKIKIKLFSFYIF